MMIALLSRFFSQNYKRCLIDWFVFFWSIFLALKLKIVGKEENGF
jgi:hypothetical protein